MIWLIHIAAWQGMHSPNYWSWCLLGWNSSWIGHFLHFLCFCWAFATWLTTMVVCLQRLVTRRPKFMANLSAKCQSAADFCKIFPSNIPDMAKTCYSGMPCATVCNWRLPLATVEGQVWRRKFLVEYVCKRRDVTKRSNKLYWLVTFGKSLSYRGYSLRSSMVNNYPRLAVTKTCQRVWNNLYQTLLEVSTRVFWAQHVALLRGRNSFHFNKMRSHRFYSLSCWCLVVFINQIQAVRITAIEDACVARDSTLTAKLEDIPRGQRASPLPSGSTSRPCATNSRVLTNIETLNDCGCSGNHFRGGFPGNNHLRSSNNLLANKQACRSPRSVNHNLAHPRPFAAPPQKDTRVGHASDHAEPYHPRRAKFSQKINLNPEAEPFIPRSTRWEQWCQIPYQRPR